MRSQAFPVVLIMYSFKTVHGGHDKRIACIQCGVHFAKKCRSGEVFYILCSRVLWLESNIRFASIAQLLPIATMAYERSKSCLVRRSPEADLADISAGMRFARSKSSPSLGYPRNMMMYFERDGMAPCRPLPPLHISDVPSASLPCIIPLRVYNAFSGRPISTELFGSLSDFIIAIDVAHAAMEVQLALRFYMNAKVTIVKPMAMDGRENFLLLCAEQGCLKEGMIDIIYLPPDNVRYI